MGGRDDASIVKIMNQEVWKRIYKLMDCLLFTTVGRVQPGCSYLSIEPICSWFTWLSSRIPWWEFQASAKKGSGYISN